MMPAQSRVDAGIWSVPGLVPVIEYSRPVLNDILTHVLDAFDTYLAGGYEVGGVLFGQHKNGLVRIQAFRPLDIQPPRPVFVLSNSDQQRFDALIKSHTSDPALQGMVPVGWYHSHTRDEIFLSEGDIEIYDRHLAEPWQVAMVLRPSDLEPVRVGFFFRESDGYIRTDQSYQEFAVEAPPRERTLRKPPPWEIRDDGQLEEDYSVPPVEPEAFSLPPEAQTAGFLKRTGRWLLLLVALATIGAGAVSLYILNAPEPLLGLRLTPVESELLIQWDTKSKALADPSQATLFIVDGSDRTDLPLAKLRGAAHYLYKPRTGRVDVRLRAGLPWGRSALELATYLAHPEIGKPEPELQEARQIERSARKNLEALQADLAQKRGETLALQARLDESARAREQADEAKRTKFAPKPLVLPPATNPPTPRDLPGAPEIAARSTAAAPPVPLQVSLSDPRMKAPPEPVKPAPVQPPPPVAVQPPPSPAIVRPAPLPPPKPAYSGPASGKIIWIGELPRDGVLRIEGRRPSTGAVNTELPGVPVHIGAYPAEYTNSGVKVFSPNPRLTAGKTEPAGAANGYTPIHYVYDAKAVRDLIVEQMPGAGDWKRIVLRAGGRRLSAIVIEWQVIPQ
ncbi:MAG: hypothetical protein IT167_20825 [Bryobacterales bacterium]|nr:hypothetical protein [Bryobacterales bacterium]